jgi:hypothetical protein
MSCFIGDREVAECARIVSLGLRVMTGPIETWLKIVIILQVITKQPLLSRSLTALNSGQEMGTSVNGSLLGFCSMLLEAALKRWYTSKILHGAAVQKISIYRR